MTYKLKKIFKINGLNNFLINIMMNWQILNIYSFPLEKKLSIKLLENKNKEISRK
jgi:hypothetical protein